MYMQATCDVMYIYCMEVTCAVLYYVAILFSAPFNGTCK